MKDENEPHGRSANDKTRQVLAQLSANDGAIFTLSVPVKNPKQKTGCSDLPLLFFAAGKEK
ncbi:hypothetical protein [Paraburkholderia fungorum]|uniref:hypothetical protein n=1 Tax=Paraburkholderia fungorum TaxID=134537 RepID=UPI0038B88F26